MENRQSEFIKLEEIFENYFSDNALWENKPDNISLLVDIISIFRSQKSKNLQEVSFLPLIELLQNNATYKNEFARYVKELLEGKNFVKIITDVGIYSTDSFAGEFRSKLYNQLLPEPASYDSVRYILSQIFFHKSDHDWVKRIPYGEVQILFNLISPPLINEDFAKKSLISQLIHGLEILTLRICGKALEKEIIKILPELDEMNSPFLALHNELEELRILISQEKKLLDPEGLAYKQTQVILTQCREYINKAYKNATKYGISLGVNKDLSRIKQQLARIEETLPILTVRNDQGYEGNTIDLFLKLILYNAQRKNLNDFLNDTGHLFAYEITSHTARTGFKYISSDRKEYLKMLCDALGGGFVVGLMCITKLMLSHVEASQFGHAFLYSANYAIGFVILYLLGFTLATKQPAMTASTLVTYLEYGLKKDLKDNYRYKKFAGFFAQLIRTQFIAFFGNVIMALPIALGGAWLLLSVFDYNVAIDDTEHLFHNLNPIKSLAILHAAIAGFYLFLSGLIAGNVSNRNKFYGIEKRITDFPLLKKTFGKEKAKKIGAWFIHYWPGIMSNMWFGIFMGTTASIGVFMGLFIDVRHITFSAGNLGLAIMGNNMSITTGQLLMSLIGIFLIGVMNFSVSFSLSLITAFKARKVPFREIKPLIYSVFKYFTYHPTEFLIPPIKESEDNITEEIIETEKEKK
ncbi:recombinase [Flavobacteriaceae bacterium Ap0902]|nr:recombinase [Flavobacteriaceae bacterium Ap0902]